MLDLTAIKARRNSIGNRITKYSVGYPLRADIDALLLEVERLQAENTRLENELEEIAQMGMDRDFAESRDEA